jgi:hypothetical protein
MSKIEQVNITNSDGETITIEPQKGPGRPQKYAIAATAVNSPSYYVSPKKNLDLEAIAEKANIKYRFDDIAAEFAGKSDAERLRVIYTDLIKRLTIEGHRFYITDIDWDDADTVRLRNAQMTNMKNTLTCIKMMQELCEKLRITDATEADIHKQLTTEAQNDLIAAQKLLANRGKSGE